MAELFAVLLSFAIGVTCSLMACCIGLYVGLFTYLNSNVENRSRLSALLMSLGFSGGIILVVAMMGAGLALVEMEVMSMMSYWKTLISVLGFVILFAIGVCYLTGRSLGFPLPYINPPKGLIKRHGYRVAPLYGILFGGPGAAHCTLMLVIPIVFISLSSGEPGAFIWNFVSFAIGRVIPIVSIGLLMQDAQIRLVRLISSRSGLVNQLIGVATIVSGVYLLLTNYLLF